MVRTGAQSGALALHADQPAVTVLDDKEGAGLQHRVLQAQSVVHPRQHRAVRAQHGWLRTFPQPAHVPLNRTSRGVLLGQRRGDVQVEVRTVDVRAQRGPAPAAAGADHPSPAVRGENRYQQLRLAFTGLGERPLALLALPGLARDGLPVPEHYQWVALLAHSRGLLERLATPPVVEEATRFVQRHPGHPVDLVVRLVLRHVVVAEHPSHPVVHDLGPQLAVGDLVLLDGRGGPEPNLQAGLLSYLAYGGR